MAKFSKTKTGKDLGSKQFFDLIRSIGEAKSKQEEDKIIAREIAVLKSKMGEKDVDKKQMKEYVVRLLYCEMLGSNAEFGYIFCVNLIASSDLLQKRTGYLAVQLTISPDCDLLYLIVSAIQKDLKSTNSLDVCCALNAATKLINAELMPCLIQDVQNCLKHQSALVRKKAIVCIHAFWRKDEMGIGDNKQYQQVLCDKDPAVMACTLSFLQDLCCLNPEENKHLVSSFVSILRQICEHRLTKEYDYHRIPAPWIQIKLLKLLAILCHQDVERSKQAYIVLGEVMKRADSGLPIGHAVIFECVKTITCLVPAPELIESAADAISKFLSSPNPNLKYLGITSLSRIVLINPIYAKEHRDVVMGCLEDHDGTIKRKTLDLLYAMTNQDSVEVIVARLARFLAAAHDVYLKSDLVTNISDLAYKYYPTMEWYIQTMNNVIKLGEQFVDNQTVQGMLKMIAEGSEELSEEENEEFRVHAVESYYELLDTSDKLPETLVQIISWVLGEYGFMSQEYSQDDITDKLCDLLEKSPDNDTRGYVCVTPNTTPQLNTTTQQIITALMKLTAQVTPVPDHVLELVASFKSSGSLALQQRCYEFLELANYGGLMSGVLPLDGCCEILEVDQDLSFLDAVVSSALARGAKDYRKNYFQTLGQEEQVATLKTAVYVNPMDKTGVTEEAAAVVVKETELALNVTESKWNKKMLEPQKEDDAPVEQQEDYEDDEEEMSPTHDANNGLEAEDGEKKKKKKKSKQDRLATIFDKPAGKKTVKKGTKKVRNTFLTLLHSTQKKTSEAASPQSDIHDGNGRAASPPSAQLGVPGLKEQLVPSVGELTMANFEKTWKSHPAEGSGALAIPPGIDVDTMADRIMEVSNIVKIQTIGTQFVAAARHNSGFVLCHFQIDSTTFSIKVRSMMPDLTAAVVQHLQSSILG